MKPIITIEKEDKLNKFAFRYHLYPLMVVFILFFIVVNIVTQLSQHSVYAADSYTLPYPGILPNHRLYPLKSVRDRLLEWFTRDLNKKAELYLLYADKRIWMAQMLGDQNEWQLAEDTASKAEKYLLKSRDAVTQSRAIGGSPNVAFLAKIKKAPYKQYEILRNLMKNSPSGNWLGFKEAVKINQEYAAWAKTQ